MILGPKFDQFVSLLQSFHSIGPQRFEPGKQCLVRTVSPPNPNQVSRIGAQQPAVNEILVLADDDSALASGGQRTFEVFAVHFVSAWSFIDCPPHLDPLPQGGGETYREFGVRSPSPPSGERVGVRGRACANNRRFRPCAPCAPSVRARFQTARLQARLVTDDISYGGDGRNRGQRRCEYGVCRILAQVPVAPSP